MVPGRDPVIMFSLTLESAHPIQTALGVCLAAIFE